MIKDAGEPVDLCSFCGYVNHRSHDCKAKEKAGELIDALTAKISAVRKIIESIRADSTNPWELLHAIDIATSHEPYETVEEIVRKLKAHESSGDSDGS